MLGAFMWLGLVSRPVCAVLGGNFVSEVRVRRAHTACHAAPREAAGKGALHATCHTLCHGASRHATPRHRMSGPTQAYVGSRRSDAGD